MCNPPFYASYDEVKELQSQKASDPFSVRHFAVVLGSVVLTRVDVGMYRSIERDDHNGRRGGVRWEDGRGKSGDWLEDPVSLFNFISAPSLYL